MFIEPIHQERITHYREDKHMTDRIKQQIEAVRVSGETNMINMGRVQRIANRKHFYELVIFIEEHASEYLDYLMNGYDSSL
jgi:hypothetical protein